ncbi:MAG: hypothetical protein HZB68_00780 [Candidatus Aenigmarchaeota archaeon]|nr:hypothetical protein [Candidatus Aenigmarchaeota archaeon]
MDKKMRKGFLPALHLFMGLVAMILTLLIIMQLLGLLNADLKKSIDSTAALTFAVSCSADKDNKIDISWTDMYYTPRSISCFSDQCCPNGKVNGANPFGETSVKCENIGTDAVPEYSCQVINFQLPQIVKTSGDPKAWTNPQFWVTGVGVPKYLVYYESFPQDEMKPFLKLMDDNLIPYMIIGGAMNAVPWNLVGGKVALKLGGVFESAGMEWLGGKLTSFGEKQVGNFLGKLVETGDVALTPLESKAMGEFADNGLGAILETGESITQGQAEAAAQALSKSVFQEAAVRSSIATSGRLATKEFFSNLKQTVSSEAGGVSDEAAEKLTYAMTEKATGLGGKITSENSDDFAREVISSLDDKTVSSLKSSLGAADDSALAERIGQVAVKAEDKGVLTDSIGRETAIELGEKGVRARIENGAKEIFDGYIKGAYNTIDDAVKSGFDKAAVKSGIKDMLSKGKDMLINPEFMQGEGMKRASETAKVLAKSKSVQYLLLEDFEQGFFNNIESDYAPYATATSNFAQCTAIVGVGKTKTAICAGLVAAGVLQQKADNYNLPQESVGINNIGLKAPFLPPYKFSLDKDAIQKYVALEKTNLFREDASKAQQNVFRAHSRLALASPCKGDVGTKLGDVECSISRCQSLDSAKKAACEGERWQAKYGSLDDCKKSESEQLCKEPKWKGKYKSEGACKLVIEANRDSYCGTVPKEALPEGTESYSKYAGALTEPKWYTSYKYGEETIKADYPVAVSGLDPISAKGPLDKDAQGYKECVMPETTLEGIGGSFSWGLGCFGEAIFSLPDVVSGKFNGCKPTDAIPVTYPSVMVKPADDTIKDTGDGNYCTAEVDAKDATALILIHGSSIGVSIAATTIGTTVCSIFTAGSCAVAGPLIASGVNFAMGAATVWLENEFVNSEWPKR